jgi:hypothetical protein
VNIVKPPDSCLKLDCMFSLNFERVCLCEQLFKMFKNCSLLSIFAFLFSGLDSLLYSAE